MSITNHLYRGTRLMVTTSYQHNMYSRPVVTVDGEPLPASALAQKKSPDGFEWGYAGSGPAALAHSILTYELSQDKPWSLLEQFISDTYQDFKTCFIERFEEQGFELDSDAIYGWIKDRHNYQFTKMKAGIYD